MLLALIVMTAIIMAVVALLAFAVIVLIGEVSGLREQVSNSLADDDDDEADDDEADDEPEGHPFPPYGRSVTKVTIGVSADCRPMVSFAPMNED